MLCIIKVFIDLFVKKNARHERDRGGREEGREGKKEGELGKKRKRPSMYYLTP